MSNSAPLTSNISGLSSGFRSWLVSKNYSSSTIRNYLSDTNAYFDFVKKSNTCDLTPAIYSSDTVRLYLKKIDKDSNYSRYLSSLSKFFQFALDQNLITVNPLKAALKDKKTSTDEIINSYQEFLVKKHFSATTIKNYLNDIRQFIDWSKLKIES